MHDVFAINQNKSVLLQILSSQLGLSLSQLIFNFKLTFSDTFHLRRPYSTIIENHLVTGA